MKLLYDRVLLKKEIRTEFVPGIIKHELSSDKRIEPFARGEVIHVGVDCVEVKPGDIVMYKAALERFIDVEGESLVEIRESNLEGIWTEAE